ncbi:MAG: hypothetical protein IJF63_04845 [Alistipes sp.]|nr:hypothetical protein [Alistipes sp.]MBQ6862248.1 hypothetical protein [Alistipes sp.]
MKLTKKQKNAIFKVFAERLAHSGYGCPFCKHYSRSDECTRCQTCDCFNKAELTERELNEPYWADVEAALENKVKQTKTKEL